MYLALFLVPWVLMYALSTMAMNHRHFASTANSFPLSGVDPLTEGRQARIDEGEDRPVKITSVRAKYAIP